MRIFMLVQHPTARGPVPKHTAHLVAALRSLGCTVVTHPWGQRRHDERLLKKLTDRARDVLSVRRALQESDQDFDVAIVKTAHDWRTLVRDLAVVLVIGRRCRPIVLQLHGSSPSELTEPGGHAFKLATALLVARVDALMVLSTEEQREWQAFRSRPPVYPVKNPYVSDSSSDRSVAAITSQSVPQLLFVGRLMREKGIFELVEAFADVILQTGCELVIVGEGQPTDEQQLRARIRHLGLESDVTMKGYLTGPALSDAYRTASIFVLPTWWGEGFPTVLAEAMDAGLPIITTRIRGAADHLAANENALFVEPRDATGLASAITVLLQDRELRERMAAANRERLRIFDPDVVAGEYLHVLQTIVDSH